MSEQMPVPILDVRSAGAFRRAHWPGAVHLHADRLLAEPYLLPPRDREFLVVGRDDAHASAIAERLRKAGWIRATAGPNVARSLLLESGPSRGHLWEPAPFLKEVEPLLPERGTAIDLACGSGRNAVYLALAGGSNSRVVLGVDILPDAIAQARRLRLASGCSATDVRFRCADLTDPKTLRSLLPPRRHAIVICFRYLDRDLLPRLAETLAPGGVLVYETFLVQQREVHGKPRNPAHLLNPDELREAFAMLEIVRYREGEDASGSFTASLLAGRPSD
jgi:SAM-dependent methyltransferase